MKKIILEIGNKAMIIHKRTKSSKLKKRNYTHPEKPRYADLGLAKRPVVVSPSFRIVSYNIKYSKKIERAIKLLGEHKELKCADIICLQEMTLEAVCAIAETLDFNYVFYPAVLHPILKKDFGNAVLSKWPIIDDKKFIIPGSNPKRSQRIAVNATINYNGTIIIVCCVHFKVFMRPTSRAEQMNSLLSALPVPAEHCIIAGDFNTFTKANNRAVLEPLVEADFIPATAGLGWSHKHWSLLYKKAQLDHIFIKGLEIVKTGKVINRKSSDHIPIWAELEFPKTQPSFEEKF